jgi:hypothetical protein
MVEHRLTLNLQCSCLYFLSAGITSVNHYASLEVTFKIKFHLKDE